MVKYLNPVLIIYLITLMKSFIILLFLFHLTMYMQKVVNIPLALCVIILSLQLILIIKWSFHFTLIISTVIIVNIFLPFKPMVI